VKIQDAISSQRSYISWWLSFYLWIINNSKDIWFYNGIIIARIAIKEERFGNVSQPNLRKCDVNSMNCSDKTVITG